MDKVIAFILGAAAGSLLTWKLIEKKYKDLADEEIESVVEHFKNKEKNEHNTPEYFEPKLTNEDTLKHSKAQENVYKNMIDDLDYDTKDKVSNEREIWIGPGDDFVEPYIISPEEFGDVDAYNAKHLTYYADFVLTNEEGDIISDPESILGDGLSHFGDFEEDAVHVRNENTWCDYEVIKHEKTFSEANGGDI